MGSEMCIRDRAVVNVNAVFSNGFIVNKSFAFQAIQNPSAHLTKLFCGFLVIFRKR